MRDHGSVDRIKDIAGILCMAISVFAVLAICRVISGDDIWYDETFSMGFIRGSYSDIVRLTAKDVHPPLYYIYLKFVTGIWTAVMGQGALIHAAKVASILPWVGLLILALTVVRKRYGIFAAGIFMMLITVMPQMAVYYVEIRMYSLALLLVTADILTALRLCDKAKTPGIAAWITFWVLGILTAYTQYYACIAIAGIYIALLVIFIVKGKEIGKRSILSLIICGVLSVSAYLPWLPILRSQMGNISGNYWIQPLTLRSIAGCVKFIILPVIDIRLVPYIAAVLVALTVLIIVVLFIRKKSADAYVPVILGVSPLIIVVLSGFILSAMGTPIFVYRYMIPALGGLYLALAIATDRISDSKISFVMICPFLLTAALSMRGFMLEEGKKTVQMDHASQVMAMIPQGSTLITNFDHVSAIMGYYRPDASVCLYDAEIDRLIPEMYDNVSDSLGDEDIPRLIRSQSDVFFLGSFNSREDIVKDWEKLGIVSELKDSCLIERYWINIYRLKQDADEESGIY